MATTTKNLTHTWKEKKKKIDPHGGKEKKTWHILV